MGASSKPEGLSRGAVLGEGRFTSIYPAVTQETSGSASSGLSVVLNEAPAAMSFGARWFLQVSSPAILLCKTVCNQLIKLT